MAKEGDGDPNLVTIDDPMPVRSVLSHVRKASVRTLVTGPFSLPTVQGKAQTSDQLVRASSCLTFAPLYGDKTPAEVERILARSTDNGYRVVDTIAAVIDSPLFRER